MLGLVAKAITLAWMLFAAIVLALFVAVARTFGFSS